MKRVFNSFIKMHTLKLGIIGFVIFLIIILGAKYFKGIFVPNYPVDIVPTDFATASIGFVLIVLFKIIDKFSDNS